MSKVVADYSAATHRTETASLQVPFTPAKNGEPSNAGPRPRSPGVAGLLSPAPLWHGTHIAGGSNGPGGGGGFHTHLVPPGLANSPAHGHASSFGGINTPHSMMRAFPDMGVGVGNGNGNGASPNLAPSLGNTTTTNSDGSQKLDLPVSPMPMYSTNEGMASIGLTPFTSGSEAATLPQVSRWYFTWFSLLCVKCIWLTSSSGPRCLGLNWMGILLLPCSRCILSVRLYATCIDDMLS